MILSNIEILNCLEAGHFKIDPSPGADPGKSPFNTSAIDLHLSNQIIVPKTDQPVSVDLSEGGIAKYLSNNSDAHSITDHQPYQLSRHEFVLANTVERVSFSLSNDGPFFAARVEGRSSLARCGIHVHFTAPVIHAGFEGTITLEITNLGFATFTLRPGMAICQLVIEEVKGKPMMASSQFQGQSSPAGNI